MTLEDRVTLLEGFVLGLQERLATLERQHRALAPIVYREATE